MYLTRFGTHAVLHNWLLNFHEYNHLWDGHLGLFEENRV